MKKSFNIDGCCSPERHYMVDISGKLDIISKQVDDRDYLAIEMSECFGKTTMVNAIYNRLSGDYLVIKLNFGEIDSSYFDGWKLWNALADEMGKAIERTPQAEQAYKLWQSIELEDNGLLYLLIKIGEFCEQMPVPVVLLVDDVDKNSQNQAFLDFLSGLRSKFSDRYRNRSFHSVMLVGVHDIKNIELKLGPYDEHCHNAPWNIAAEFKADMSFNALDISTMLTDYEADNNTGMDIKSISEEIFRYTNGHPYLISAICKVIDEELGRDWTLAGVQKAAYKITRAGNVLFTNLTQDLDNREDFRDFIYATAVRGSRIFFYIYDKCMRFGTTHSYLKSDANRRAAVYNLMFEQVVFDYFIKQDAVRRSKNQERFIDNAGSECIVDGKLDFSRVITKFWTFMREEHEGKDQEFIEEHGRLLFLNFLKLLLGDKGYYYVDPDTRNYGCMIVVVTYGGEEIVAEIKFWSRPEYQTAGQKQLADFLQAHGHDTGYLMTFDFTKGELQTEPSWVECDGKRIFEAVI